MIPYRLNHRPKGAPLQVAERDITELGNGVITLRNPTGGGVQRVRGLFYKLFGRVAVIRITGGFGGKPGERVWDIRKRGNPRPVLFVGRDYVTADLGEMGPGKPVMLRLSDGGRVEVFFSLPKEA